MSRRRFLSTEISVDRQVNRMGTKHGDAAVLLYTWMIPHASDDATITGDPFELLGTVWPGRRDKTEEDVIAALGAMEEFGLIRWDREGAIIYFPESFYRYQTYIKPANRRAPTTSDIQRKTLQNVADQRGSAQNSASLSPSPSLSLSNTNTPPIVPHAEKAAEEVAPDIAPDAAPTRQMPSPKGHKAPTAQLDEEWAQVWGIFPNRMEQTHARRNWESLRKTQSHEDLLAAVNRYATWFEAQDEERRQYPYKLANFFGRKAYWKDWVSPDEDVGKTDDSPRYFQPTEAFRVYWEAETARELAEARAHPLQRRGPPIPGALDLKEWCEHARERITAGQSLVGGAESPAN